MTLHADLAALALQALSLLLAAAGVAKLRRPAPLTGLLAQARLPRPAVIARGLGLGEAAAGGVGLLLGGRAGAIVIAAAFAGLLGGSISIARTSRDQPCGCFGDEDGAPIGSRHTALNALAVAGAAAAAVSAPGGLPSSLSHRPGTAAAILGLAVALAMLLRTLLNARAGALDRSAIRLVDTSAHVIAAKLSRRSLLSRMAVAGSALAVAPLRYLLYPGTALAVVVPSSCGEGLCTDGYTAFCCEITEGQRNGCPAGTFPGGWWMCTDYRGHQLCGDAGVRYYVDCNALPGHPFPGGCRCAQGSCENRRVACNVFRYGQCNGQIEGTTAVVCRMVVCENPGSIPGLNCSSSVMVDDAVCGHEARCLEPPAVQLHGVGGA